MSRYECLCNEYQTALARFNQYTEDCYTFVEQFFIAFKDYLECPGEAIRFYAPQDELDTTQRCSLREAMLHNQDGFYTIYFSLTIKLQNAQDTVLGVLRVKKTDSCFVIRVGMDRKDFSITDKESMVNAFEYIWTGIKTYYQKDGFIKSISSPIGFAV